MTTLIKLKPRRQPIVLSKAELQTFERLIKIALRDHLARRDRTTEKKDAE